MSEILIGLAMGMGGAVVLSVLSFILIRTISSSRDAAIARANKREDEHEDREDLLIAERDSAREGEKILHDNQVSLLAEIGELKTENASLAASKAAAEKATHDLLRAVQDNPGTLAPALVVAAQRLREQLSPGDKAAPSAAADPRGEVEGAVHGGSDDLEPP